MVRPVPLFLLTALLSIGCGMSPAAAQEKVGSKAAPKPGTPSDSPEDITKRLTEKVERIQAGAQKWAASGRDPAEIFKAMQEKFQPLMQAGKVVEAEAVLDRVLKQFGMDAKSPAAALASDAAEERVLARIHLIQKERPAWLKKTDKQAESDLLMQKLKVQLANINLAEAEKTADEILSLMGLSIAPAAPAAHDERPATADVSMQASNPLAAFFPPQLVFLASDRIVLTPKQREALQAKVNSTHPRLEELKAVQERESAALSKLTSQQHMDEATVLAQLNTTMDAEREARQLQASLGVTIKNLLTSEQQVQLRELMRNPDAVANLEEEFKNRITAKVERVTAEAQQLAQSGRDPSFVARAMEQTVRPLMESGRIFEAEAEIDRVLEQLNQDSK